MIYNIPSAWLHRRSFDRDAFAPIWKAFVQLTDSKPQHAVNSAIYHLRKSYNSPALLDEFFELYSGLESLNSALQRKYGLRTTEIRQCTCGAPIKTLVATGVKYAIITLPGKSTDIWKSVRNTRIAMVHRHGALQNVMTSLYDNVLVTRQALRNAIFDLLGLQSAADSAHIGIQQPSAILISSTLH